MRQCHGLPQSAFVSRTQLCGAATAYASLGSWLLLGLASQIHIVVADLLLSLNAAVTARRRSQSRHLSHVRQRISRVLYPNPQTAAHYFS